MKDKTITNNHFDYVNTIVKILGFDSVADFETHIQYPMLKSKQDIICTEINKTIGLFKKLFPLEGFDLRKINYLFENIDQVLGFVKKLFGYLGISSDNSRVKGIPTLRLIPPNNLYSKYIMNLREIPQNLNSISEKNLSGEKSNAKSDRVVVSEWKNSSITPDFILPNCNPDKVIVSEWKNSSIKPDFILQNGNPDKVVVSEWKNSSITPDFILSNGNQDIKSIPMSQLIEQFEKQEVSKKIICGKKINLNQIQMDWINEIKITCLSDNKILSQGSDVSLLIGDEEIILHTVDEKKLEDYKKHDGIMKINFPNNFIYPFSQVHLLIMSKNDFENIQETSNKSQSDRVEDLMFEDLTEDVKFELEAWGFNVLNKNSISKIISSSYVQPIVFDHEFQFSQKGFGFAIHHNQINLNNKDFHNPYFLNMSFIMGYLKKPYEKKYLIDNILNLSNISSSFDYFYWIRIRNRDGSKINLETKIWLEIGGSNVLEINVVDKQTQFESDNYFKFPIDLTSNKFFKYHDMKLFIGELTNNYEIVVRGSQLKSTIPKYFFDCVIIFNHDPKWFVDGEKRYISCSGMFANQISNKKKSVLNELELMALFKKYEADKLVYANLIKSESGLVDTLILIDNKQLISEICNYGLMFLVSKLFKEYLIEGKYLDLNKSKYFSIGYNYLLDKNMKPTICEINDNNTIDLYWEIKRCADMISCVDLITRFDTKSTYEFKAWIKYNNTIIYDFGIVKSSKNIQLKCTNEIINLVNKLYGQTFLVIEIPKSKIKDWEVVSISINYIYSDTEFRRSLAMESDTSSNIKVIS